ncbi:MAG: hypothetical protein GY845_09590 [Planctomycetes bacterium]|nr:hypothetical protein [Planctomycetota bacterium]
MVVMILSIGLIMVSDWFALIPVGMALFGLTWIKKRIEVIVNEANDAG